MTIYSLNDFRSDLWDYLAAPSPEKLGTIDQKISMNYPKSEFRKDLYKLVCCRSFEAFEKVRQRIAKKYQLVQFQRNFKHLVEKHRETPHEVLNPLHLVNWTLMDLSEFEKEKALNWVMGKIHELESPLSLRAAAVGASAALCLSGGGLGSLLLVGGAAAWGYSWFQNGLNGGVKDDKASSIFGALAGAGASLFTSAGLIRTSLYGAVAAGAYKCYKAYQTLGEPSASRPSSPQAAQSSPQSAPAPRTPPQLRLRPRRLFQTPA